MNRWKRVLAILAVLAGLESIAMAQCIVGTNCLSLPNDTTTGTLTNHLAKVTGAPSAALVTTAGDTSGAIGVSVNGGTAGVARIQYQGSALCAFDGATTAGDYVTISASVAGDCTDAGATCPANENVGQIFQTHAGAGTYPLLLQINTCTGSGGGAVTGAGTANKVTKWSGATSVVNSQIGDTGTLITIPGIVDLSTATLQGGSPLVFDGTTADANKLTLVVTDPTAARTFTLPNANSVAVQPDTGTANNFLTAVSALGVISKAQPTYANIAAGAASGITTLSMSGQLTNTLATGTAPMVISSTTPVANLTAVPLTYNAAGTQQTAAHVVEGTCTLGTNCTVTLTGAAAFTTATSYGCGASDFTSAGAVKIIQAAGSLTITGTGTDVIQYVCIGN